MRNYFIAIFIVCFGVNGFGQSKIYTKIRVQVDTLSSRWRVCAHDSTFSLKNFGITSIILVNGGDCFGKCPQYVNTRLDDSLDPNNTNQINFSSGDTDVCFNVLVDNPYDSAYAPIYIIDSMDYIRFIELHYYPKANKVPSVNSENSFLIIQPNPATGSFITISLPSPSENTQIIIYDLLGREVSCKKIPDGIMQTELPITNLENGIYYIDLVSENFHASQKFVVEH